MMKMRHTVWSILLLPVALLLLACHDTDSLHYDVHEVNVRLGDSLRLADDFGGMEVKLTDTKGSVFKCTTDEDGVARFQVPVGVYQASVSYSQQLGEGRKLIFNGIENNIVVTDGWLSADDVHLWLTVTNSSTIIIRELYVGGCPKDDGSGWFQRDKYCILCNNCPERVVLPNLCLGIGTPYNSFGINKNYGEDGKLVYEREGFIPASNAFWYFQGDEVVFEPWEEKVIALNGAIDHTQTYSQSINFAHADYYCTYDIEQYINTNFYPVPADVIPTSHYLRVVKYGDEMESAWPLSTSSPAFFIFSLPDRTPLEFGNDADNIWYDEGRALPTFTCKRVSTDWVLDGVEVYSTAWAEATKRLTPAVDVGYVYMDRRVGHSVERRVDEAETRRMGHIVYQDTNNSCNDFYERPKASLRD